MSNDTVRSVAPVPGTPSDKLRLKLQLLREKLSHAKERGETQFADPIDFIAHGRRVTEDHPVPEPFYKIAAELSQIAGADVTHETVRRWNRAFTTPIVIAEPAA